MKSPRYINWIIEEKGVVLEDNTPITCYVLDYTIDEAAFNNWALHLRRHYITDADLKESILITGKSVEEYLKEYVIPQKNDEFGATSRSNDITEILVSDILEFVHGYKVPRCKQQNRSGKTQSEHGTDIIAYKFYREDKKPSKYDELVAAEVKAHLTSTDPDVIVSAVEDPKKDEHRVAHTLDYYRKKLKYIGNIPESAEVSRFQLKTEKDYKTVLIGTAVSSQTGIPDKVIMGITNEHLCLETNQKIFYIHGKKLMDLTHAIYERCVQ